MEALLTYLLKSAALLSIFYLIYLLLLKNETNFTDNRKFLLSGIFASAILPAVYFTRKVRVEAKNFSADEISINTNVYSENPASNLEIWEVAGIIYCVITAFFLIKISLQLYSIYKLINKNNRSNDENYRFIKTETAVNPFSFFKFIVYNPTAHSEEDLKMILLHEKVHASQWHSLDILIANLTTALLWFNPLSWLYKKSVEQNLEYIADRETVAISGAVKSYQKTLVKVSIPQLQSALTNQFYQSFIKKRILMLNKNTRSNYTFLKMGFVFPLILMFLLSFNVKTETLSISSEENNISTTSSEAKHKILEAHFSENTSETDLEEYKTTFAEREVKLDWSNLEFSNGKLKNIYITYTLETGDTQNFQSETDENGKLQPFKLRAKFYESGNVAFIAIGNKKEGEPENSKLVEQEVETLANKKLPEDLVYKIDGKTASLEDVEALKPDEIANMKVIKDEKAIQEAGEKAKNGVILITTKTAENEKKISGDPVYILNGEISKKEIVDLIDTDLIESVNVLKGESAVSLYGKNAKDGAVIITTKVLEKEKDKKINGTGFIINKDEQKPARVSFQSYSKRRKTLVPKAENIIATQHVGMENTVNLKQLDNLFLSEKSFNESQPLIIINGKKQSTDFNIDDINPEEIKSINVLKKDAAKSYKNPENGVIEITTKD